jgi:hypothetical protein
MVEEPNQEEQRPAYHGLHDHARSGGLPLLGSKAIESARDNPRKFRYRRTLKIYILYAREGRADYCVV